MITREENAALTQVGADTPMGRYMRCFWHPVAALAALEAEPVLPVTVLGEHLTLFRAEDGALGLVAERCPHRGVPLACGFVEGSGLRCAYHAWKFDPRGHCVDQPAEPAQSRLKDTIRITNYPVEELGGLVFAYLGKRPTPLLPRWEFLVNDEFDHEVGVTRMPCNWLQIAENNMDPQHVEFLHMMYINSRHKRAGLPPVRQRHHVKTAFEIFEYGIIKKRLWAGESEDADEWKVGHPMLFPNTNIFSPTPSLVQAMFRVPVDDTNTIIYWYNAKRRPAGEAPRRAVPAKDVPWYDEDGNFMRDKVPGQDMMVMTQQGGVADRTQENLGTSDRGIVLYRRTLLDQAARVTRGEDPLGVVRDPVKNTPWITLPLEGSMGFAFHGLTNFEYDKPPAAAVAE